MLRVDRKAVVALFIGLEFKTAVDWDDAKLRVKIGELPEIIEDDDPPSDPAAKKLLKKLLAAVSNDEEINFEIEGGKPATAKRGKPPVAADPSDDPSNDDLDMAVDPSDDDFEGDNPSDDDDPSDDETIEVLPSMARLQVTTKPAVVQTTTNTPGIRELADLLRHLADALLAGAALLQRIQQPPTTPGNGQASEITARCKPGRPKKNPT